MDIQYVRNSKRGGKILTELKVIEMQHSTQELFSNKQRAEY